MSGPDAAAIARLEVQVANLTSTVGHLSAVLDKTATKVDGIETKLDQSAGGLMVFKWLGFGSLASVIATGAAVYAWFKH